MAAAGRRRPWRRRQRPTTAGGGVSAAGGGGGAATLAAALGALCVLLSCGPLLAQAQGTGTLAPIGSTLPADFMTDAEKALAALEAELQRQKVDYCTYLEVWVPTISDPDICTTTTKTTTTITRTETTTKGPKTTTTTPQPRECRTLCDANGHPWFVKCGWAVCATCGPCANVVIPTTGPPKTIANFSFMTTTTTTTISTSTSSSTTTPEPPRGGGGGSVTVQTTRLRTTTVTMIDMGQTTTAPTTGVPVYNCIPGCYKETNDWGTKCGWAICLNCIECDGTTTTTTVTETSTSTVTTSTTLTSTKTSTYTGTLAETETRTSTSTTSTETTTKSTTTATKTMTTTALPCARPASVFATLGCQDNFTSGSTCVTETLRHPCVTPSNLTFICPAKNKIPDLEPILDSGNTSLKCRICGMLSTYVQDEDPRNGTVKYTLSFGPNAMDGEVDEFVVTGYYVYFADGCSRKLGAPVGYVEKKFDASASCCQIDAYVVEVMGEFPSEENVTLMVVPNTDVGELSVGMTTDPIEDYIAATTPPPPVEPPGGVEVRTVIIGVAGGIAGGCGCIFLMLWRAWCIMSGPKVSRVRPT